MSAPLHKRDRTAFLAGLWIGGALSSLLIGALFATVGEALIDGMPDRAVTLLLVTVGFALMAAEILLGRPIATRRQTPQRFVHWLTPGPLGLVYGLDIGTLFSTQKATTAIWIGIFGLSLRAPTVVPVVILAGHTIWWTFALGELLFSERRGLIMIRMNARRQLRFVRLASVTLSSLILFFAVAAPWVG